MGTGLLVSAQAVQWPEESASHSFAHPCGLVGGFGLEHAGVAGMCCDFCTSVRPSLGSRCTMKLLPFPTFSHQLPQLGGQQGPWQESHVGFAILQNEIFGDDTNFLNIPNPTPQKMLLNIVKV